LLEVDGDRVENVDDVTSRDGAEVEAEERDAGRVERLH
jgi:hypothetical protein